jgi:hypothetical protein
LNSPNSSQGKSAILKLTELANNQESIEVILAYYCLSKSPMNKNDLQKKCGNLILEIKKLTYIKFEVEDALKKMKNLGILKEKSGIYYVRNHEKTFKILIQYHQQELTKDLESTFENV